MAAKVVEMKARVVAVANQKGGVGKTTTAISLGATLAAYERQTLLVDLDPQSNCSSGLGFRDNGEQPTSYDLVLGDATVAMAAQPSEFPHLALVPATPHLAGAEIDLVGMVGIAPGAGHHVADFVMRSQATRQVNMTLFSSIVRPRSAF